NGPGNGNDNGAAIGVDGNGNVYVAGTSQGKTSNLDFVTLKYNSAGLTTLQRSVPENITNSVALSIYPNPAHSSFTLQLPDENLYSITITDVLGKTVFEQQTVKNQLRVNTEKFGQGNYFINARNNNTSLTLKFTKQ